MILPPLRSRFLLSNQCKFVLATPARSPWLKSSLRLSLPSPVFLSRIFLSQSRSGSFGCGFPLWVHPWLSPCLVAACTAEFRDFSDWDFIGIWGLGFGICRCV